jgi:hypothetical protein
VVPPLPWKPGRRPRSPRLPMRGFTITLLLDALSGAGDTGHAA